MAAATKRAAAAKDFILNRVLVERLWDERVEFGRGAEVEEAGELAKAKADDEDGEEEKAFHVSRRRYIYISWTQE
jgi:hypothetical protein